jgi:hypothetical protein
MGRYAVQEVNVPLFKPRFQGRRTCCTMIWVSLSIPHRSCSLFFSERFAALYRSSSVLAYPSFLWQWKGTKRNVSVQTFKIIPLHVSQSPRGPHVWHRDPSAYPHSRPEMPWPACPSCRPSPRLRMEISPPASGRRASRWQHETFMKWRTERAGWKGRRQPGHKKWNSYVRSLYATFDLFMSLHCQRPPPPTGQHVSHPSLNCLTSS